MTVQVHGGVVDEGLAERIATEEFDSRPPPPPPPKSQGRRANGHHATGIFSWHISTLRVYGPCVPSNMLTSTRLLWYVVEIRL